MAHIFFEDNKIEFQVKGQGPTVVLLHGYLESLMVWEKIADRLSKQYQIVAIDLPGHGNSSLIEPLTMEVMTKVVNAVLEHLNVQTCTMIGHSMGGYVTLDFFAHYPEKLTGFCLFHSTPFADDEQHKTYRDQLISLISGGKHILLAKEHVEKTFAKLNLEKFLTEIGFLKIIAVNTKAQSAIAALQAMKTRKDYSQLFENSRIKTLWIIGEQDNFISKDVIKKIKMPEHSETVVLDEVGHQGYIENMELSLQKLEAFLSKTNYN